MKIRKLVKPLVEECEDKISELISEMVGQAEEDGELTGMQLEDITNVYFDLEQLVIKKLIEKLNKKIN